ncbi:MAG: hypothetical protein HN742_26665 [Lentisphaerae bacterium]|jgi:uroporphyrinogen-III decarboxylase|nr:hypothetical protein [Lentisphaerota bacterium]MBT4822888.1 hypothetical protein [Lentisphaerota bacterium]MBT5606047.1 hypothetical protein [Lentisphaerota bacterium]MBT7058564.1 hypothetical protein [Lentisphaerota bacterium]MBT7845486.1 hypothetical protein [Lentisphaerota bacterium]
MSRQLALDTIHLKPTERLAHTEYSLNYHKEYVKEKTGQEAGHPDATRSLYEQWAIDFSFGVNDGLHGNWGALGRATNMGHAVYAADGSDLRQPHESPFKDPEDVWAFDPAAEYGLPDMDEQVAAYEKAFQDTKAAFPDQLSTGGYYKSTVSGAIAAFGWDMLLMACADRDKMSEVFIRFREFTQHHMNAWAQTSAEVIIQHDDFVWTEGAFMHPDIYREVIIPGFAELWKPLKAAGKTIIFCSDGNFMEFAEDIAKAGADGFIFEPMVEFGFMVERFGKSHCLVGSAVDCTDMAFHPWETVKDSMDKTLDLAQQCKGLIWAVGNHIPANVSSEMMDLYIDYFLANCRR